MKKILARTPLLYLITDRKQLTQNRDFGEIRSLADFVQKAASAGVDLIQIREKDLSSRAVYEIVEAAAERLQGSGVSLLVNDRADIAASVGLAMPGSQIGVHLTSTSLPASVVRRAFGDDILIAVSTHSVEEVVEAESGGADFVVFGPVFETPSKREYGPPKGIESLKAAVSAASIPVVALGGINRSNYKRVLDTDAAGIAGISLFAEARDLEGLVNEMKSYASKRPA